MRWLALFGTAGDALRQPVRRRRLLRPPRPLPRTRTAIPRYGVEVPPRRPRRPGRQRRGASPSPRRSSPTTGSRAGRGSRGSTSTTPSASTASACRSSSSPRSSRSSPSSRAGRSSKSVRGYLDPRAPARNRRDRRVPRARLLPLLRLLRSDAAADVLPHRPVGRRAAEVRGDQVRPLHAARQRRPSGRDDRPVHGERPRLRRSGRGPAEGAPSCARTNPTLTDESKRSQQVEVHTFDFVTLSKVGRAVMLILNGQEDRLAAQDAADGRPRAGRRRAARCKLFAPGVKPAEAIARLKAQPVCTKQFQYLVLRAAVPRLRGEGADRARCTRGCRTPTSRRRRRSA